MVDTPPLLGGCDHGAAAHAASGLWCRPGFRQEVPLVVHFPGTPLTSSCTLCDVESLPPNFDVYLFKGSSLLIVSMFFYQRLIQEMRMRGGRSSIASNRWLSSALRMELSDRAGRAVVAGAGDDGAESLSEAAHVHAHRARQKPRHGRCVWRVKRRLRPTSHPVPAPLLPAAAPVLDW